MRPALIVRIVRLAARPQFVKYRNPPILNQSPFCSFGVCWFVPVLDTGVFLAIVVAAFVNKAIWILLPHFVRIDYSVTVFVVISKEILIRMRIVCVNISVRVQSIQVNRHGTCQDDRYSFPTCFQRRRILFRSFCRRQSAVWSFSDSQA